MFTRPDKWLFAPTFESTRRARLEGAEETRALFGRIVSELSNLSYEIELGYANGLEGCKRPIFTFAVGNETFDAFFNGPTGYRAQYLAKADLGQAWNNLLLNELEARLLTAATTFNTPHEMNRDELQLSLSGMSAKVWVHENDFPFQALTEDLAVESWKAAALMGVKKATWGLCAPLGSRLQVKGAFLDPYRNEVVPGDKVRRRFDIAAFGFS